MSSDKKFHFILIRNFKSLTCFSRRSYVICIPILFYVIFMSLTSFFAIPLRSVRGQESSNPHFRNEDLLENVSLRTFKVPSTPETGKEPYFTLEEIFHKADSSNDGFLNAEEVSIWINKKTKEHIRNAIMENYGLFTAIDIHPRNGVVSWDEYHTYFLRKQGLSNRYIKDHNERHSGLTREIKEIIMKDRAAWSEAAKSDPDHLTLDEFLAFRHPESSHATILSLVEELLDKFDRDGDEILTEDEFSTLESDNENEKTGIQVQGESERRREFREVVDQNSDGKATRKELLFYIDPKNPRHAKEEAETLMVLADMDHDGRLSLLEVFNKMDLFMGSKMVDTARSFHDEF